MDAVADLELHRTALTGHCYRMLGSVVEAEDAVQETMIRAWRGLDRFDGRASLRNWMYRIATNVCLDTIGERAPRVRAVEDAPAGAVDDPLVERPRTHWLEPIPDSLAVPCDSSPAERAILKQSIRLAFVATLQHLPSKQRAVLLLMEVLGWSAAEVAESLDTSIASVNSALQRARATLASRNITEPEPLSENQTRLLDRYVDAFHRYDVDELASLLREDATMSMPPYSLWLRGRDAVRGWLLGRGSVCRGSRVVPIEICGSPGYGHYHVTSQGKYEPWAIIVLELVGNGIAEWNSFLDTSLFPQFGLPRELA